MKKIPHLYLDMDGVQADFFTQWAKWHGQKTKDPEIQRYKQIGDHSQRQASIQAMQKAGPEFVYKFFATLPELGGGMRLLNWIVQNKIPCTVLTAPLANPEGDTTNAIRDASIECARYIMDSDCEQVSYQQYIEDGNDPRDHILYLASVVLGEENEEFQNDIREYDKTTNHNSRV